MPFVILELTDVRVSSPLASICKGMVALAVWFDILELTDLLVSIGPGSGALAVLFAIPPLTDVLVSIGIGIGALAVNTVTTNTDCPALS